MDFRAVLILLCMLCTQAPCSPAGSRAPERALNDTIRLVLQESRRALDHVDDFLPNISCSSVNITQHVGLKQQPLSAHRLSFVRCYMQKLSSCIPDLSIELMKAAQFIQDVEQRLSNLTTPQNCSFPAFEQEIEAFVFAKCFLELVLEEKLSKPKL